MLIMTSYCDSNASSAWFLDCSWIYGAFLMTTEIVFDALMMADYF